MHGPSALSLLALRSQLTSRSCRYCPQCKTNRPAVKKLSLSKLPPILVIHLKRFSFHGPFSDKVRRSSTDLCRLLCAC